MKLLKIISSLLIIFVFTTKAFAQSPADLTVVADVNIQNPQIISQLQNNINISFTLTNGEGVQSGVKYGVRLVKNTNSGQFIYDEKVYDDTVFLAENSSVEKTIIYQPPATLSGKFNIYITSFNASNFPFSIASVGEVTLASTQKGTVIQVESCTLQQGTSAAVNIKTPLTLNQGSEIKLLCTVNNTSDVAIIATPRFETRLGGLFGDVVEQKGGSAEPINFAAKESKKINITLPSVSKPQVYAVTTWLDTNGAQSNFVTAKYSIAGNTALIENVSFDKDTYSKGDTVNASIVWSASQETVNMEAVIVNKTGGICSDTVSRLFNFNDKPAGKISLSLNKPCDQSKVKITLKDEGGNVLDEKLFAITNNSQAESVEKKVNPLLFIIPLIIILLGIGIVIYKKNNSKTNKPMSNLVLILLIGGIISFFPVGNNDLYARTFKAGSKDQFTLTANLPRGEKYTKSANIDVEAWISRGSESNPNLTTVSIPAKLTVSNNGGAHIKLIPDATNTATEIKLLPNQTSDIYSYTFKNPNGAPSVNGTYPMDFKISLNEPEVVPCSAVAHMDSGTNWGFYAYPQTIYDVLANGATIYPTKLNIHWDVLTYPNRFVVKTYPEGNVVYSTDDYDNDGVADDYMDPKGVPDGGNGYKGDAKYTGPWGSGYSTAKPFSIGPWNWTLSIPAVPNQRYYKIEIQTATDPLSGNDAWDFSLSCS
jgi:hypothetical protein